MTVGIAVRCDHGVVCATDTALTYGGNRFHTAGIKGFHRWDGFTMYAGSAWAAHEVMYDESDLPLHDLIKSKTKRFKDSEKHPSFPAEFLKVSYDGDIFVYDEGAVFGSYDYACIGSGSSVAWPVIDVLYKRVRNRTIGNTKKMLGEVLRMCEKYDTGVYRPFIYEVV